MQGHRCSGIPKRIAGFTEGTPWYRVNPNYKEINVEQALADPESVFYHYQKLIQLRKEHEVMVYGTYQLLFPEDEDLYIYTRTLEEEKWLIVCNFHEKTRKLQCKRAGQVMLSNYADTPAAVKKLQNSDHMRRLFIRWNPGMRIMENADKIIVLILKPILSWCSSESVFERPYKNNYHLKIRPWRRFRQLCAGGSVKEAHRISEDADSPDIFRARFHRDG